MEIASIEVLPEGSDAAVRVLSMVAGAMEKCA